MKENFNVADYYHYFMCAVCFVSDDNGELDKRS